MKCPQCGEEGHQVLFYKGTPILMCPKAEEGKIKCFSFPETPQSGTVGGIYRDPLKLKGRKNDLITTPGFKDIPRSKFKMFQTPAGEAVDKLAKDIRREIDLAEKRGAERMFQVITENWAEVEDADKQYCFDIWHTKRENNT